MGIMSNQHQLLTELGRMLKYKQTVLNDAKIQVKKIKEEIREMMIDHGKLKKFDNDDANIHISVKYGRSFDLGMFKLENPGFSASFITHETVIKENEIFDKKRLKERYPKEYEKYMLDLTPAVSVK